LLVTLSSQLLGSVSIKDLQKVVSEIILISLSAALYWLCHSAETLIKLPLCVREESVLEKGFYSIHLVHGSYLLSRAFLIILILSVARSFKRRNMSMDHMHFWTYSSPSIVMQQSEI
jgi:hypothetical protein